MPKCPSATPCLLDPPWGNIGRQGRRAVRGAGLPQGSSPVLGPALWTAQPLWSVSTSPASSPDTRPWAPGRGAGSFSTRQPGRQDTGQVDAPAAWPLLSPREGHTTLAAPVWEPTSSSEKNLVFLIKGKQTGIYDCTCFWVCTDSRRIHHLCLARKRLHFFPQAHAMNINFSEASSTPAKATDQDVYVLGIHRLVPRPILRAPSLPTLPRRLSRESGLHLKNQTFRFPASESAVS